MGPLNKLTVRVCHENPVLLAGLLSLLDQAPDLDVRAGPDAGDEALVDVIVADYAFALELLDCVPAGSGTPPIVVVTRRGTECDVVHAINRGVDGYLLQDSEPSELIASIRHLARGGLRYLCMKSASVLETASRTQLTPRETQVLKLLAHGDCNKTISRKLEISTHTVKAHVARLCEKLQVHSRAQVAAEAARRGLVRT